MATESPATVYLIDGTYELFRHFHAMPSQRDADGLEVAGLLGVLRSILGLIEGGARYVGVATDHVIESFRNDLWPGYKSSIGMDPAILGQFQPLEDALSAMGVVTWPMVELEADDALASAAARFAPLSAVDQVIICTPDKDLAQSVQGRQVVQLNRRTGAVLDEAGVHLKYGVGPASIPDYLALVGDSADGYPGLPGWGARSAAVVLDAFGSLEEVPLDIRRWPPVRGAERLKDTLIERLSEALLFRELATLRTDAALDAELEHLRWSGPTPGFAALCQHLGEPGLAERARLSRAAS